MRWLLSAGLLAGVLAAFVPAVPAAEQLDRIVAVVGEGVILESELDAATRQIQARLGPEAQRIPEDVLRSQVLDQLIIKRLQTQRAEKAGMRVEDSEVNAALQRLAQQNGMSLDQFLRNIRADGMEPQDLRERLRDELLINKLRQREVNSRIVVTEEDVDRYLESESLRVQENREYRIRHLLISLPDGASPEQVRAARQRIETLRERAVSGTASFSDLVIAHSDGQKALEGGDLGWLAGGYLPTVFSEVVPKLEVGEISEPFRGASGYHLIKLEDVRATGNAAAPDEQVIVEEVKARHILLELNEIRDDERARREAEKLRERILAGDDFAELARQHSDDPGSANQGGDLGWAPAEAYNPAFAERLRQLEAGEISEPFKSPNGWHIVEVLDRRERDQTEERRRARARQALGRRKVEEEGEVWLRRLRDEAYVEIRMDDYKKDAEIGG
ncbi:peptidylprolyl isomerase [Salinisphaera sp. PC39]|uniref:peptidylprolyl isomerase n=1 Tax=Salinisphaera sp. PC39 TaxID=1304156 RepID=UPI003342127C